MTDLTKYIYLLIGYFEIGCPFFSWLMLLMTCESHDHPATWHPPFQHSLLACQALSTTYFISLKLWTGARQSWFIFQKKKKKLSPTQVTYDAVKLHTHTHTLICQDIGNMFHPCPMSFDTKNDTTTTSNNNRNVLLGGKWSNTTRHFSKRPQFSIWFAINLLIERTFALSSLEMT